jgi:four helix bundle protein
VDRFEDAIAWQKARVLNRAIYEATRGPRFCKDFGLCSQIQRSSISVMANIAEGFERNRDGEFHQFLSIAKGSCAEVRSHLYAAFDIGYIDDEQFHQLKGSAEEVSRIIAGLRTSIERRRSGAPH